MPVTYTFTTPGGEVVETPTNIDVTVKNPCVDQAFVTIMESPLNMLQYELTTGALPYKAHNFFKVVTVPIVHDLCGALTYSATYDGSPITNTDMPLAYEPSTRVFTAESSDVALDMMTKPYTVGAEFTAWPLATYPTVSTA